MFKKKFIVLAVLTVAVFAVNAVAKPPAMPTEVPVTIERGTLSPVTVYEGETYSLPPGNHIPESVTLKLAEPQYG